MAADSGILISVIVPTHNRCKYLINTIKSLQEQSLDPQRYEIIVVDNNSTDKTEDAVKQTNSTGGKEVIYLKENILGLQHARHSGAKIARGKVIAYTDDDGIYSRDWLSELLKFYDDEKVGCVGGKVLPKWEVPPPNFIKRFPEGYLSLLDYGNEPKELDDCGIYGVNFSVRRDLIFSLGGFHPGMIGSVRFGDCEIGLLKKVQGAGYKIMYAPGAVCFHVIPAERLTFAYMKRRAEQQGASISFAEYREKRYDKKKLIARVIRFSFYAIAHYIFAILKKLKNNDAWYSQIGHSHYYLGRIKYEYNLLSDRSLREMNLKNNWI